jgi:CheY-like chemotaxis protein
MSVTICAPPPSTLAGLRVLVVGVPPQFGVRWSALLAANGAHAATARSPFAALNLLARARFDVVVVDLGLPHAGAYDLARALRELGPDVGGDTPALAVLAPGSRYDQAHALAARFAAHIVHDAWPDEMVAAVAWAA